MQGPAGADPRIGDHPLDAQLLTALVNIQRGLPGLIGQQAEVIVIGAPIRAMRAVFTQLAGRTEGKVVTDMASTKAGVMEWAAVAGIDLVGGHPMCGKEASGIDAADASLFKDAPWVLTRGEPALVDLVEAVEAAGFDQGVEGSPA